MSLNKWILFCNAVFFSTQVLNAQNIEKEMSEFDAFVKSQQKEFADFVDKQNREFIQFLKENWESYDSKQTDVRPQRPEPVVPVKVNAEKEPPALKPKHIPVEEIQKIPKVVPSTAFPELTDNGKTPSEDKTVTLPTAENSQPFDFYGIPCKVDLSMKGCVHLRGISEQEISAGWETLSKKNFQVLVNNCLNIKRNYQLNDYAYLLYVEKAASQLLVQKNDIVLLQAFILCQSGYKVKMARINGKLALLYASDEMIYGTTYLMVNGERYYKWGSRVENGTSIYTYAKNFADSKYPISMNFTKEPLFYGQVRNRELQSRKYPEIKITSQVHEGLITFYKSYPQCDLSIYFNAPVNKTVENSVVNGLRKAIQGKSQIEAANMLIDFVQTAFAYKTDDEQFGYEKPFFIEELFYYPFCDCEDRAFLYSYLIRELLNLDVVLLDYPNHVATAVCFSEQVEGDYIMVGRKKYIICDPTYIGATIGMAMPQFKSVSAKVLMK